MINLTSLPYPMFHTTTEEKEILKQCELYYQSLLLPENSQKVPFMGLCQVIDNMTSSSLTLLIKIKNCLKGNSYLHWYLESHILPFHVWLRNVEGFELIKLQNTLRRIWVAKLLSYED